MQTKANQNQKLFTEVIFNNFNNFQQNHIDFTLFDENWSDWIDEKKKKIKLQQNWF